MSGLETERLQERIRGMTEDQQRIIVQALPDKILWEALYGRFLYLQERVTGIHPLMDSGGD